MTLLALALLGLSDSAHGQAFDSHGAPLPPDGANVRDPALGLGGGFTGIPVFTLLTEATTRVLVERVSDGDTFVDRPVVDDLFGINLGASSRIAGPVGLGLSAPVWFLSDGSAGGGFALGDTQVWAPITLMSGELRLGAAPYIGLPTGADRRYLGEPGFSFGALATGGMDFGDFFAHADLGFDHAPPNPTQEWPGGVHSRVVTDIGWSPNEDLGLHLEWRSRIPLVSAAPTLPSELMATGKFRPVDRIWVNASVGTALTRGVGAPGVRTLIGVTAAPGKRPVETEIALGPPPKEVHVMDERRFPLTGAVVSVGGASSQTDYEGYALVPAKAINRTGVIEVQLEGYETVTLPVTPDDPWWEVTMRRKPVSVAVSVVGPEGVLQLVDATVEGPYDPGQPVIDEAGVFNWNLRSGTWTVTMTSPGLGDQKRTIIIEHDRTDPIRVDAVLANLVQEENQITINVVDRLGRPVEDAVVQIHNRDLGTTGTGGDLVVKGLENGAMQFRVRSELYGADAVIDFEITDGSHELEAVLDWRPGSLHVTAADPNGFPLDAAVSFVGPETLSPRDLGQDGEELFILGPGTWDIIASADGMGSQRRRVKITEREGKLTSLEFGLMKAEDGNSELQIQIADVDGKPLAEVDVTLDGMHLGRTGPNGDITASGLHPGLRNLTVAGKLLVPDEFEIDLVSGTQTERHAMFWVDGVTDVWVTTAEGAPIDARIGFEGPSVLDGLQVGVDGYERMILPQGEWKLYFSAPEMGGQTRNLRVKSNGKRRQELRVTLDEIQPEVADIAVVVTDPDGNVVENAQVSLDGQTIGDTADGVVIAEGVSAGTSEVMVVAEGMRVAEQTVEIQPETPDTAPDTELEEADLPEGTDTAEAEREQPETITTVWGTEVSAEPEAEDAAEDSGSSSDTDNSEAVPADDASSPAEPKVDEVVGRDQAIAMAEEVGAEVVAVELEWAPGALEVSVVDEDTGEVVEATVTLHGEQETLAPRTAVGGETTIGASPGKWTMVVEAEGMETQEIPLNLSEEAKLNEVAVEMNRMDEDETRVLVQAETPQGTAIANAEVKVDGVVVGRTTEAGTFEVEEELFEEKTAVVEIVPESGYESIEVEIAAPRQRDKGEEVKHTVVADHVTREVAVVVADPDGGAVEAKIVAVGGETLEAPVDVGDDGVAILDLAPGTYTITAETETGELASAEVTVLPEDTRAAADILGEEAVEELGWNEVALSGDAGGSDSADPESRPQSVAVTGDAEVVRADDISFLQANEDSGSGDAPEEYEDVVWTIGGGSSSAPSADVQAVAGSDIPVVAFTVSSVRSQVVDNKLMPVDPILFDTGRHALRAEVEPLIVDLARWLKTHHEAAIVEVGGHTDDVGGVVMNQQLSERRANAVMVALIAQGVPAERLSARGYGLSRPITSKTDSESRQSNRRVELSVLEWAAD